MASAVPPTDRLPAGMTRPHFVGIGGAGMSGIAGILAVRGAEVSGSDARESATVEALRRAGVRVAVGHAAENLPAGADCVVANSAIRPENPELLAAAERGLPVVHRSDALAALMDGRRALAVAGTHGKTGTTSMLAVALRELGLDPSYAIGGDLDEPGSNGHHGSGEIFVAEADESDRSFQKYSPEVAIVLNVELDHHANYASLEEVYESFELFVARITPGGTLVVSADDPGARELTRRVADREGLNVLTVGTAAGADVRIESYTPRGMAGTVRLALPERFGGGKLEFDISVPGRHSASNASAALAAAAALGVPVAELGRAVTEYRGVRRRLQLKGSERGVQVIDSYAHHPTEIAADIDAIRDHAGEGRVVVVYQPHLYSRTQELGAEMGKALAAADLVLLMEIYPAREDPIAGITSAIVADAARAEHGAEVLAAGPAEGIPGRVREVVRAGDLVLTMGAGDVTELGPRILGELRG
jgi:UDP-N-acetylmuramate--alanine ligase